MLLTVNKLFTKDCEQQIHAWVNYESILQKCIVGRLVNEELFKLPNILKAATDVSENDLNMDWFQQLGFLCFVFYTKTPYPEVFKLFIHSWKYFYLEVMVSNNYLFNDIFCDLSFSFF